jgi:hypothetical protein
MSGFGIVVMEGSVVQAQHDGPGVLYASACAVRAETSVGGNPGGTRPTLTVERMRVVVAGGSRVEVASTDSSSATYSRAKARRAHAASVQVIPGGVAVVNQFVVAVVVSSVVNASCDDSCAAAGFTAAGRKRGELDIGASDVPTSLAAQRVVLIASGPDSSVALHARGGGRGSSVMGAAAAGATVSLKNATLFVAGPRTSVSLHIRGDGGGRAASVLGVAAHNQGPSNAVAKAEMLDVTALVFGPDTNVSLRVTGGEAGFGVAVLGAASFFGGAVTMLGCSVIVLGPTTKIGIDIADGGNGLGAAVMGAAAASFDSSATMGSTTMYAASPGSSTSLRIAGRGNAATVLGVAGYLEAKLVIQNVAFNAWGPDATILLTIDDACGCGASALGMSTHLDCTLTGAASTFTRCESRNVAIVVPGGTPSQTAVQDAPGGLGASFSVPTLSECEQFAAPLPVLVRQIDVLVTALLLPTATRTRGTATISASQPPTSSRGSPSSGASATGTPLPTERDEVTPRTATLIVAPPPPTAAASTTAVAASIAPPTPPPPTTDPPPQPGRTRTVTVAAQNASNAAALDVVVVVPAPVSAAVAVLSGVLLRSSVNKPQGVARVLRLLDVCLDVVNSADDSEDGILHAAPGDWPSDFAVVVARWQIGGDAAGDAAAAAGRGAGSAVAIAGCMLCCAAVVIFVASRRAAATPEAKSTASASPMVIAVVVGAGYLVPSALEAGVVAATAAGPSAAVRLVGGAGAVALLAVVVPGLTVAARGVPLPLTRFLHPVIIDGLRDEGRVILRAHALLDFSIACVVAIVGAVLQAGARYDGSCVVPMLLMSAAATTLTAYYVFMRPFEARLEVIVAATQAGTLAALCCVSLVVVATNGTGVPGEVLEVAGFMAEGVSLAAPVVLLIPIAMARLSPSSAEGLKPAVPDRKDDSAHQPLLVAPPPIGDTNRHGEHDATGPPAGRRHQRDDRRRRAPRADDAPSRRNNPLAPERRHR